MSEVLGLKDTEKSVSYPQSQTYNEAIDFHMAW